LNPEGSVSSSIGLYREGNQVMWKGLPVPRREHFYGKEYYISLDKDNYINIVDNGIVSDNVNIINPISGNSVGTRPLPLNSKRMYIRDFDDAPDYVAETDSYLGEIRTTNVFVGNPSVSSTSVDESTLPSFSNVSKPDNIPTSPIPIPLSSSKGKERAMDIFDDVQLYPREVNWGDRTPL
jgi:hypothetical protein